MALTALEIKDKTFGVKFRGNERFIESICFDCTRYS